MTENEKVEFDFIKEKIKEKPLNKKRLVKKGVFTIVFAILFGLVASLVFVIMQPVWEGELYPKESQTITIPEDEWYMDTETELPTETLKETEEEVEKEKAEETEEPEETPTVMPQPTNGNGEVLPEEQMLQEYQVIQNKVYAIGKAKNNAIVTVQSVVDDIDWYNNIFESYGQSSGMILGDNGDSLLILTEYGAIQDAKSIRVTFFDGTIRDATLLSYDGNTGLTIIKVPLNQLEEETIEKISYMPLGNSLRLSQGNIVVAVGSPLGTNYSIEVGNVTSVGNVIQTIDNSFSVFTTDIMSCENSSGAVLDLKGELVGLIMTEYNGVTGGNSLTAVSVSELKKVIEMLSNNKDIPYAGLKMVTVTDEIAKANGIPKGIFVKEVCVDSPAMEAGLQIADVIVEIDGEAVNNVEGYETKLLSLKPGDKMNVTVKRQGQDGYSRIDCEVTVGKIEK